MSRYLLDTHTLIWWWTNPARLGPNAREVLMSDSNAIVVSAASVWEIAIKRRSGRLTEIVNFEQDYPQLMERNGFEKLAMRDDHVLRAGLMPGDHNDPFDRVLAAQGLIENLPLVTCDRAMAAFGCEVLW